MPVTPGRALRWWAVRVGGVVAMLAAIGLLASCLGPGTGVSGTGGTGTPGTSGSSGNGYGGHGGDAGNGGTGGNGGAGIGGVGGNGYGGHGGDANNGGTGGNGGAGIGGNGGDDTTGGADATSGGGFFEPTGLAGSGRLTSRTLELSGVTSVVVGADFVVHLRTGGPPRAIVRMDDNLTDRIEATVTGNQLRLGIKPGGSVRNATLSAEVTVGQLDRLETSGASRVTINPALTNPALASPALWLTVSGASEVTGPVALGQVVAGVSGTGTLALSGQAQDLRLSAAGASQLPMAQLAVRHLDATLSGASHVTVAVTDTLAAQVAGVSVLRYRGAPSIISSRTSGMSSIVRYSP